MKVPKIINSKLRILNSSIVGITLWPYIFLNFKKIPENRLNFTINHETIHIKQQEELFVVFFYVWYVTEWIIKLLFYGNKAYYHISFEREAYKFEKDLEYLKRRKKFSFVKYIF